MLRIFALGVLVATMWPHVAAMRCAIPDPGSHGAHASAVSEHTHEAPDCPATLACSSSMLESVTAAYVAEPHVPPRRHLSTAATAPSATVLPTDPPPPRRVA